MSFQREVAGIEEPNDCVRIVTSERLSSRRKKEGIVPSPDREKRWLRRAEVGLEFGIAFDIALVVAKQIQLHFVGTGACQIEVVEGLAIRRDRGRVVNAVGV